MTETEVNRFRAVITARVAELERFTRHRDAITVERSADQLEEIQAASQRALAVCNLDREFNQLRDARAALRRIQEGTFGTCRECDEDIHPKRLAAVTWATFVYGARKPLTATLKRWIPQVATSFAPPKVVVFRLATRSKCKAP